MYVEKLTSEVRTLEDKLHAADYANHVLQQKLARLEAGAGVMSEERPPAVGANSEDVDIRITPDRAPRRPAAPAELPGDASDLDLEIDLGQPVAPEEARPGARREARPDARTERDAPPDTLPPVQPLPPRAGEFETPPIELGEPLPPGEPDDDALPPGQIPTPESARMLFPAPPAAIAIHPGLSGRHHHDSDDLEDGLFLVLTISDAEGRPVRCEQPISVVLLDPAQSGEAARLGRWDFTAQEVQEKYRATPVPSIQLPILWQEARPSSDAVAVFVRLQNGAETPLETDMLMEFTANSGAEWTTRGRGPYSAQISPEQAWK